MDNQILLDKINDIIDKRLFNVAPTVRKFLPYIFSRNNPNWSIISTNEFILVVFGSKHDKNRIRNLSAHGYDPFPGLITRDIKIGTAFRFEKSQNILIDSCTVTNAFSISLGKDSTIILVNHTQSINTQELGQYKYIIPLAFLLSYGEEITQSTIYDYFEDLVAYSVSSWRQKNAT